MGIVKNLFHVNIVAKDYENMLHFYRDICGLEQVLVVSQGASNRMFGKPWTAEDEATPRLTYLRVAPEEYVEIVNGKVKECLPAHVDGTYHSMTFTSSDLEKTISELTAAGVELFSTSGREQLRNEMPLPRDAQGTAYVWMFDPEGTAIRIIQE